MTTTESVRKSEAKRIALGHRQIRVWVPEDNKEVVAYIRKLAADACKVAAPPKAIKKTEAEVRLLARQRSESAYAMYKEGKSNREIGEALGITRGYATALVNRAVYRDEFRAWRIENPTLATMAFPGPGRWRK